MSVYFIAIGKKTVRVAYYRNYWQMQSPIWSRNLQQLNKWDHDLGQNLVILSSVA